jgi:hypothetical protein
MVCSIFKTIELKVIYTSQDPTWDGVNLSIWSSVEASIGILIASLPPLRKAFDHIFQNVFPSILQSSNHKTSQHSFGTSSHGNIRMNTFLNSKAYHSRLGDDSVLDNDGDSDRAILENEEGKSAGIMKTMKVTVSEEAKASSSEGSEASQKQSNDWAPPQPDKYSHHAL